MASERELRDMFGGRSDAEVAAMFAAPRIPRTSTRNSGSATAPQPDTTLKTKRKRKQNTNPRKQAKTTIYTAATDGNPTTPQDDVEGPTPLPISPIPSNVEDEDLLETRSSKRRKGATILIETPNQPGERLRSESVASVDMALPTPLSTDTSIMTSARRTTRSARGSKSNRKSPFLMRSLSATTPESALPSCISIVDSPIALGFDKDQTTAAGEGAGPEIPLALSFPISSSGDKEQDLQFPTHKHLIQPEAADHTSSFADPDLGRISDAFAQLSRMKQKPEPEGQPLVWADARQELCEALPYFRAYQGAGYSHDGVVYSFMFDGESHSRDYMDSNVVISRAGGGLAKDKETKQMVMTGDQKEGHLVESLRNNMRTFQPVAIISGQKNPTAQFKVPHIYCVLDWFKPTHIWYEKSKGKCLLRYRFELLKPKNPSWWKGKGVDEPVTLGQLAPPHIQKCARCQKENPQVYLNGWMCLESVCASFWKLGDGNEPNENDLRYDPRFLKQQTAWPVESAPFATKPEPWVLQSTGTDHIKDDLVWEATRAIVCPDCGRCSARLHWERWQCTCGKSYEMPHRVVPPHRLHDWLNPVTDAYAWSHDKWDPSINFHVEFIGNYRVHIFEIPGIDGFVAHMMANKTVNEEPGGPDSMFLELQKTDLGLERREMEHSQMKGGTVCNHFTKNFGMPYKFIAAAESSSFEDAPQAIKHSRSRLNWAARTLLKDKFGEEFNEVLALAYMEKNKISYHDDGETGLGPTIATLSLGYPAVMQIRMKKKHYQGASKNEVYIDRQPLPGCVKYQERKKAHDELQKLKGDPAAYKIRTQQIPKELRLREKQGNAKPVIELKLMHGGIVIMHGQAIQEVYEHAVTPEDKLRFALTCRHIELYSLKQADRPAWEVMPDEGNYDGLALPLPAQ